MAKYANDTVMDIALNLLKNNCLKISVLTNTPADAAQASNTSTAICVGSLTTSMFALSDDSTYSGRKVTISSSTGLTVATTGKAAYVAIFSTATANSSMTSTGLFYYTSCATQTVGSTANKVTIDAFTITIQDPT
jgi:hypothetical protein